MASTNPGGHMDEHAPHRSPPAHARALTAAQSSPARWIAAVFLLQGFIGPVINFSLLAPALSAPPGFLENAALHARDVQLATLLMLVGTACSVGVGLALWSISPPSSRALAVTYLVLAMLAFAASILEGTAIRGMLALSRAFHDSAGADVRVFEPVRVTLQALRLNAHYTVLLLSGIGFVALYRCVRRLGWIPRVLAIAGVIAAVVSVGAALWPLLGGPTVFELFIPLGLCQLALVAWLFVAPAARVVPPRELYA